MHRSKKTTRWLLTGLVLTLVVGTVKSLPEDTPEPSRLDEIKERGKLVVLTRNGASSYFVGAEGPTGPEFELAEAFATHLGVEIEARVASSYEQLGQWLDSNEGDLIAANLTRTAERSLQYRFGPEYSSTHTSVVYRKGLKAPQSLADLAGLRVAVIAGSSYEELLTEAAESTPGLAWQTRMNAGIEDLLLDIDHGDLDATLVDSRVFNIHDRYYPGVLESVNVGEEQSQAWAFRHDDDDSLALQAEVFIRQARENGLIDGIQQQFFANEEHHLKDHDMLRFLERVRERLPTFMHVFQDVGNDTVLTGAYWQRWATRNLTGTRMRSRPPEFAG